jgi:hypothetical protein
MVKVVGMLSLHTDVVNKADVADLDLLKSPRNNDKNKIDNQLQFQDMLSFNSSSTANRSGTYHFPNNFTSVAVSAILTNYKSIKLINC